MDMCECHCVECIERRQLEDHLRGEREMHEQMIKSLRKRCQEIAVDQLFMEQDRSRRPCAGQAIPSKVSPPDPAIEALWEKMR